MPRLTICQNHLVASSVIWPLASLIRDGRGGGGLFAVLAALAMLLYAVDLLMVMGSVYYSRPLGVGVFSFPLLGCDRERVPAGARSLFVGLWSSILQDMPGKQVKNWSQYEALRRQGYSKESAARIANASTSRKRKGKKGRRQTDR